MRYFTILISLTSLLNPAARQSLGDAGIENGTSPFVHPQQLNYYNVSIFSTSHPIIFKAFYSLFFIMQCCVGEGPAEPNRKRRGRGGGEEGQEEESQGGQEEEGQQGRGGQEEEEAEGQQQGRAGPLTDCRHAARPSGGKSIRERSRVSGAAHFLHFRIWANSGSYSYSYSFKLKSMLFLLKSNFR